MRLLAIAFFGLTVAASASADTMVYDLAPQNAKETAEAINNALRTQCSSPTENGGLFSSCRADLLPTGQLLVEAPASSQAKIGEVIKAIAARGAAPTPRVTLQYWVLSGASGKPDATDPALKPLSAVLQQIEKLHGDLGFKIEDSALLTTQSGTLARNGGGAFEVSENVRANGDNVNADIRLKFTRLAPTPPTPSAQVQIYQPLQSELSMTAVIRRGEYLVLGESKFNLPDQSGTLFYVVHWPEGQ